MLRIDLLPKSFRIARLNKLMLVGVLVVLGLVAAYWLQTGATVKGQIAETERQIASVQDAANQYDKTMAELGEKQAELQPIADKISFVDAADKSGEIYWELYHKLKRYIYAKAQMENFSIRPPNTCSFTVQVTGTTQYARFLLNLLRCPDLTITSFTVLSAGRGVPSVGQPEPGTWPTARGKVSTGGEQAAPTRAAGPAGAVPGMGPVGMGGPGMGGMPGAGGPPSGMPGSPMMGGPGGPPGGMAGPPGGAPGMGGMPGGPPGMGGMGPGGMGGMMGGARAGAAGGATTSPDRQPITIQVAGILSTTITTPMPPGAGAAGAGMPGMGAGAPGGMPGMGGAPGGMLGVGGAPGGMPGAGAPGAGRPGAAPGAGAAPGGRAGRRGEAEEEEAGGGLGRRRGMEGGEE